MNVFDFRDKLVADYAAYVRSFITIQDERITSKVADELQRGLLWPDPLIQLNPSFEPGNWIDNLVEEGISHPECRRIFQLDKDKNQHRNRQYVRDHSHTATGRSRRSAPSAW